MPLTAAIDVGSTTVRGAVFDGHKRLSIALANLRSQHRFKGAVEHDPTEIKDLTIKVLNRSLRDAGLQFAKISALGITNQRASVVAWDRSTGVPLCPVISWQDTRTAARVAEFVALGIPLNTAASCTKLEWLLNNKTSVANAAANKTLSFGTLDTYLTCVLSGGSDGSNGHVYVTDPSNAGATGFYDPHSGDWSQEILDVFGVPSAALPKVVASDEVVGYTNSELLGAAVPLAARCGDQSASCVVHGLLEGTAKLTLGTSGTLDIGSASTIAEAPIGCYTLPLWRRNIDGNLVEQYMVEGAILAAGSVIEWLIRVGLLSSVEHLDRVAQTATQDIEFLPALVGLGAPHLDPDARGVISGIDLATKASDLVAGALNGIAKQVAELVAHMAVTSPLYVDGGLSQSQVLLAKIQERTGLEVKPSKDHETALRGVAYLAQSREA